MKRFFSKYWPHLLLTAIVLILGWMLLGPDRKSGSGRSGSGGGSKWDPDDFPLEMGEAGDNVLSLQQAMNRIGPVMPDYEEIAEDGRFGEETMGAYNLFGEPYPVTESAFNSIEGMTV